ncbi:SRPBCC family protein [Flavobacterium silvaticum]|uniref:Activator of HSP90 ATPase n=1 Tax=Flavobacterium silvaticum TaxID=1852020 RepID=A0A972FUM5_9FLAO|nr:SRPBCC family protein [Flavobacterium silvaticum]NMH27905.1 activator of HSP90 ATPase [Flavobacterium silvaticum]
MNPSAITVSATVDASLEKTWDYWTKPEHIVNWAFASDDWHCPKATNDATTGGKFSSTMAAKDGSMSFDFEGIYDEVIDHKKITYTIADGRKVEILFEGQNGKTLVTETFDPESMNPIEMQRGGWQAILDNFKKYTEGN